MTLYILGLIKDIDKYLYLYRKHKNQENNKHFCKLRNLVQRPYILKIKLKKIGQSLKSYDNNFKTLDTNITKTIVEILFQILIV